MGTCALILAVTGCSGGSERDGASAATEQRFTCVAGVNVGDGEPRPTKGELERLCGNQPAPQPNAGLPAAAGVRAKRGRRLVVESGCLACHRIGRAGHDGPGQDLTDIASRLPPSAIRRTLISPTAPMPSYRSLGKGKLDAMVAYLVQRRAP